MTSETNRKILEKAGFGRQNVQGSMSKTPKFFEEWAKRNGMRPVCKVEDPTGAILLADSHEPITIDTETGKPVGWSIALPGSKFKRVYRTGYSIHREGLEIGNVHDYDTADFAFMMRDTGIQKRVNEALEHARQTQQQLIDAGYYDAERKGRFSLRPH